MASVKKLKKGYQNDLLMDWLNNATAEQIKKTGASPSQIRLIAYGHRKAAPEYASLIEAATGGLVTRQQLRPEDWTWIWPELAAA